MSNYWPKLLAHLSLFQDICTIVNFKTSDCSPRTARPYTKLRSPIYRAQPYHEPKRNTGNKPNVRKSPVGQQLPNRHRTFQHYNTFDNTFAGQHQRVDRPPLRFVGVRNGTRIYRRLRHPNLADSRRNRFLNQRNANQKENVLPEAQIIWLRSTDGKRRIKLKRRSGAAVISYRTNSQDSDRGRETPRTGGQFPQLRKSSGDNFGHIPGRRHFRRQISSMTKLPQKKIISEKEVPKIFRINTKRYALPQNSEKTVKQVNNMKLNSTYIFQRSRNNNRRFRRLRRMKRIQRILSSPRRLRSTMLKTLLEKLKRDAKRFSYYTTGNTNTVVNETISSVIPSSYDFNGVNGQNHISNISDDDNEIHILRNSSLSPSEKFFALLRSKIMTNLKEAVISIDNRDTELTYGEDRNPVEHRPLFVELEDTDFMNPFLFDMISIFPEDMNISAIDTEELRGFSGYNDTLRENEDYFIEEKVAVIDVNKTLSNEETPDSTNDTNRKELKERNRTIDETKDDTHSIIRNLGIWNSTIDFVTVNEFISLPLNDSQNSLSVNLTSNFQEQLTTIHNNYSEVNDSLDNGTSRYYLPNNFFIDVHAEGERNDTNLLISRSENEAELPDNASFIKVEKEDIVGFNSDSGRLFRNNSSNYKSTIAVILIAPVKDRLFSFVDENICDGNISSNCSVGQFNRSLPYNNDYFQSNKENNSLMTHSFDVRPTSTNKTSKVYEFGEKNESYFMMNNTYTDYFSDYETYINVTLIGDGPLGQFRSKNETHNEGNLENLPLPIVTLIIGLHMLM